MQAIITKVIHETAHKDKRIVARSPREKITISCSKLDNILTEQGVPHNSEHEERMHVLAAKMLMEKLEWSNYEIKTGQIYNGWFVHVLTPNYTHLGH